MLGADVHESLRAALLRDPATLTAPVSTLRDKYELLPAFLAVRGLVKQHIDSFNYLVEQDVRVPLRLSRRSAILSLTPRRADAEDCASQGERKGDVRRRSKLLSQVRLCGLRRIAVQPLRAVVWQVHEYLRRHAQRGGRRLHAAADAA